MKNCTLCPRNCGVSRSGDNLGFCGMPNEITVARAALHMWEEPCISGSRGSGTVFFSGCPLRCVYCQNSDISASGFGKRVSPSRLREIFFELIDKGAHNINLVTPTHYVPQILEALDGGLPVPLVYNCGGYEKVDTLRSLDGKVQIYLPDFKYAFEDTAVKYSTAPNYPQIAKDSIMEMYRQTGPCVFDGEGMLKKGVIIRHLILPGNIENTFAVIDWVSDTFPNGEILFSLMSQFTPHGDISKFPELQTRLSCYEYDLASAYLEASGITDGFFQELSSAQEEYIPPFDLTGI